MMTKRKSIFVFGSNLAGRHGKGAALYARQYHGATYGVGVGPQGDSYAIPTKDKNLQRLTLREINKHVDKFIEYAKINQSIDFELTLIGCGLAGYRYDQIGPMFKNCPSNVKIPVEFSPYIRN